MIKVAVLLVSVLSAAVSAQAQQQATPVNGDTRLVTFNYDADQTYLILVRPKAMTHIQLRPDEKVVTLGAGDTSNFALVVSVNKNNVLIRPKYSDMTTSVTLITTERSYPIMLRSTEEGTGKWYQRVTWNFDDQLIEDVGATHGPVRTRTDVQPTASSQAEKPSLPPATVPLPIDKMNFGYSVEGTADFKPLHVFDDGVRTYLRMPDQIEVLPALFALTDGSDGQVLNYTISDKYMVVQGTHRALLLKLGKGEVRINRGKSSGFFESLMGSRGG
jgi:type IV secretion system protein TrbG